LFKEVSTATPVGVIPVGIVAITLFVEPSITETDPSPWCWRI